MRLPLSLALVTSMLAIAVALEIALFGEAHLLTKLPLVALVAWAAMRPAPRGRW